MLGAVVGLVLRGVDGHVLAGGDRLVGDLERGAVVLQRVVGGLEAGLLVVGHRQVALVDGVGADLLAGIALERAGEGRGLVPDHGRGTVGQLGVGLAVDLALGVGADDEGGLGDGDRASVGNCSGSVSNRYILSHLDVVDSGVFEGGICGVPVPDHFALLIHLDVMLFTKSNASNPLNLIEILIG